MVYSCDLHVSVATLVCAFEVMRPPACASFYTSSQLYDEVCMLCGVHRSPLLYSVLTAMVECFYCTKFVGPVCYFRFVHSLSVHMFCNSLTHSDLCLCLCPLNLIRRFFQRETRILGQAHVGPHGSVYCPFEPHARRTTRASSPAASWLLFAPLEPGPDGLHC